MHDNWFLYEQMRDAGISSHEVYKQGRIHGLDRLALMRMLRFVFSLSLVEAKEVMIQADGVASSSSEYQAQLLPDLEEASRLNEGQTES